MFQTLFHLKIIFVQMILYKFTFVYYFDFLYSEVFGQLSFKFLINQTRYYYYQNQTFRNKAVS